MVTDLSQVIKSHIDNLETQLFTSLPAIIQSFDPETQTATVRPVGLEAYTDGISQPFPDNFKVPVIFPSAGGGSLTFPVKKGDEVLVTFSARNYDNWWDTSDPQVLASSQRFHDYNDAVIHLGLKSKSNSVKANTEDVELKFNDNVIRLKSDGTVQVESTSTVSISNQQEELVNLLSETIKAISEITTNTIYGPTIINNKQDFIALKDRLDTFKE